MLPRMVRIQGKEVTFKFDELPNLERLKGLYDGNLSKVVADIEFIDPRRFSIKQRKLFFAILEDIFRWSGNSTEVLKDYFYAEYSTKTYGGLISFKNDSTTTMSEATLMLELVIDFVLQNDVPINKAFYLLPKDEAYWGYYCCKNRKCMECGRKADIHHVDALGMGSNRTKAKHLKHHFMALCRFHHVEIEQIGRPAFAKKYHMPVDGVKLDLETLKNLNIQGDYSNDK